MATAAVPIQALKTAALEKLSVKTSFASPESGGPL
jgi:hypothetical protein